MSETKREMLILVLTNNLEYAIKEAKKEAHLE